MSAYQLPEIKLKLPCTSGELLPRKGEFVQFFDDIAKIPSELEAYLVTYAGQLADDVVAQIQDVIKTVNDFIDKLSKLMSPYWKKGSVRNWQKEIKDAWGELIAEFHIYIPVKILELINKIIPVDFNINVLGITINLLKILDKEEQQNIMLQIAEKGDDIYNMIPEPLRFWEGEWGVDCAEWRTKLTWDYIKTEIVNGLSGLLLKMFAKLIKKFKSIWDALGLPPIPDLLNFDVGAFIKEEMARIKAKAEEEVKRIQDDLDEFANSEFDVQGAVYSIVIKELENIELFGYRLVDIIGEIDESVTMAEDKIRELVKAAQDWVSQWQKELILIWIKKIKKFLDKIGLGKILDLLTIDFCEVLAIIGIPTSIELNLPKIKLPEPSIA